MKHQSVLASWAIVLALVLVASGSNVSAAETPTPRWLPTSTIQTPLPWPAPDLAMNSEGRSLIVWVHSQGGVVHLDASERSPGAPGWPLPSELSWPNPNSTPQVAMDAREDAIVVEPGEPHSDNGPATAWYWSGAARRWQPPAPLSAAGVRVVRVEVGMDEAGNAVAVWERYRADQDLLEASYRQAGQGSWGPPTVMLSSVELQSWQLAVAPDGSALIAARLLDGGSSGDRFDVEAISGAHGRWQAPRQVATDLQGGFEIAAAAGAPGRALVAWDEVISGNEVVRAASYTAGAGWEAPRELSFPDGQACCPAIALDGAGNAVAVWATTPDVEASTRSGSGPWARPVALSAPLFLGDGRISVNMNAGGEALAAWRGLTLDLGHELVQAAVFTPESGWQQTTTLDTSAWGRAPSLSTALDAEGDGLVVWDRFESQTPGGYLLFSVQAALLDAGGPLVHAVYPLKLPSITGRARVGHALTCRVGMWSGDRPITFVYRWLRNRRLAGSSSRYRPRLSDVGDSLRCHVTATNLLGSAQATSAMVRIRP
jgi:hypothetical protein